MKLTSVFQTIAFLAVSADAVNPRAKTTSKRKELWKPEVGAKWEMILNQVFKLPSGGASKLDPSVTVYDLDLYDNSKETFAALQKAGKHVICYFSAGSWEDWRDDKDEFPAKDLGKVLDGWPDEKWVNTKSTAIRAIMAKRIKVAADKGCDAIDPDNMDAYNNDNGLGLTQADTISYVKFLSKEAEKYNMVMGMKNSGEVTEQILPYVGFAVNEQCIEYKECGLYTPYIDGDKPVFNVEYPKGAPNVKASDKKKICSTTGDAAGSDGFSKIIKKLSLDTWTLYC
ncbi:endo alpha- polygalactosaminidase precursor [Fusarium langsethiae]|uniref:alpha-galactosidase n=1 Tax=Fusarium langsethiae TaxID=179993 RepID=A0A0N0DBF4_FUSLA|nr:endo alpha- polygalactosaminidase precursor [Fusarium langsethiae]GKU07131.1 unnamed protein product [Fusarium langsethiae]GKU22402.1 unnamed protein product [Fusarium langsethiae]